MNHHLRIPALLALPVFLVILAFPGPALLAQQPDTGSPSTLEFDSYGGNTAIRGEATGFFHLQEIDGRHFLVTPEGNAYRALGINHFHMMTSTDYDGAIENIRNWGFNAGCYQGPRWMWDRYPYTKGINLVPVCWWMPEDRFEFRDVFDPEFLAELEEQIRKIVQPQSENKNLIGYFWTDIPVWGRERYGEDWISFYKGLPGESEGAKVWRRWKDAHPDSDENEFTSLIARQIYAKGYAYIRKYDRNHLIFGDRYHEIDIPDRIVREALPYLDALAVQPTTKEFNHRFFDTLYETYGLPIYIADHVSSYATEAFPVTMEQSAPDPESYVAYYERYVTTALTRPYMVGYNKCQYQNEMARQGGGMLKQGMIDFNGQPYPTAEGVRAANLKALKLVWE